MKFDFTEVFNFAGAFHGMRNPLESWERSDSYFGFMNYNYPVDAREDVIYNWVEQEFIKQGLEVEPFTEKWEDTWGKYSDWLSSNETLRTDYEIADIATLGPKDLELAQKLILAGSEHCKFMRQIFVSVDITAPIYWWKEFDTYKVGTTANSTSTMHKLASKPITSEYFEFDSGDELEITNYTIPHGGECGLVYSDYQEDIIDMCENLRQKYLKTKDKRYWRALVQILPESWLQTRTVTMSYSNLRNIYFQRRDHKLTEWHDFCDWIKSLPYAGELIMLEDKNETN